MTEFAGRTGGTGARATDVVHESYSFACMRCGHGWEQSYEIEHHLDAEGTMFVTYVADGTVVPSPLSHPSCQNCGGQVLRIMRPGRVSSAQRPMYGQRHRPARAAVPRPETGIPDVPATGGAAGKRHHWHLSDLLHLFQHRTS
jgi:DNA-directed RNA polymerase subunit RPC12/RpoP